MNMIMLQMGHGGPRRAAHMGFGPGHHCRRFRAGFPHMRRQRMVQCMLGRRIRRMRAKVQWLQRMREMRKQRMETMVNIHTSFG